MQAPGFFISSNGVVNPLKMPPSKALMQSWVGCAHLYKIPLNNDMLMVVASSSMYNEVNPVATTVMRHTAMKESTPMMWVYGPAIVLHALDDPDYVPF